MKLYGVLLSSAILLGSCGTSSHLKDPNDLYQKSIQASMYPPTAAVDTNLIAINSANQKLIHKTINGEDHILVVTWKSNDFYPDSGAYSTGKYQMWVTTAPELKQRMASEKYKDPDTRLKQLLGLPPAAKYSLFIEFWVRPVDIFRPCPDKEISDGKCNLCFNAQDSGDMNHIRWINENRLDSYYACGLQNQYPWTQLGYTYDWNPHNKSHIGLCEFVIDTNKIIYVNGKYITQDYLNRP
jgi:hypothetical protein